MDRLLASLQIAIALILACAALATGINLILISMRPETISVVNAMIGQGVLIVCLIALARLLLIKGVARWRQLAEKGDSSR